MFDTNIERLPAIEDSHLQSAITKHPRDLLEKSLDPTSGFYYHPWRLTIEKIKKLQLIYTIKYDSEYLYSKFFKSLYSDNEFLQTTYKNNTDKYINTMINISYNTTIDQISNIPTFPIQLVKIMTETAKNNINKMELKRLIEKPYTVKMFMEEIRDTIQYQTIKNKQNGNIIQNNKWEIMGYKITYIRPLVLILDKKNKDVYVLDYHQLLLIIDTITSRINVLTMLSISNQIELTVYPKIEDYISILKWGDKILTKLGNEGYRIIKYFESLILSKLLIIDDPLDVSIEYYKNIRIAIQNDIKEYKLNITDEVIKELDNIIDKYKSSPSSLSELFGLYRLWGHPTVNERGGCKKIKDIVKETKKIDINILKMMRAKFIENFVRQYISRHRTWPLCTISDEAKGTDLFTWWSNNKVTFPKTTSNTSLLTWNHINLLKNFSYDFNMDVIRLLKDTAISLPRSNWTSIYERSIIGEGFRTHTTYTRRALKEYLRREKVDMIEIFKTISEKRVPFDWKVVGLHPKEREMKIEPRLFAMLVLEMRLYFCSTESNLSESIFKYFPQQTMDLNETDITKRLLNLTDINSINLMKFIIIIMNIDFKRWNLQFTYESTFYIFELLDKLFGLTNIYTYTHQFFFSSLIYLVSMFCPPTGIKITDILSEDIDLDTAWTKHSRGFEGLRQKGWTLITECALMLVYDLTGIYSKINGQGDNQVLLIYIPKLNDEPYLDYVRNYKDDILQKLEIYKKSLISVSNGFGIPIKDEESWISTSTLAYSKDIIHNGAQLPMSLKRASRIMPDINDSLPTLSNKIATIYAAGRSVAIKGLSIIPAYFTTQMEACSVILKEFTFSTLLGKSINKNIQQIGITYNLMYFLTTLPKNFGGLPVLSFYDFFYRGHPDPLTSSLFTIKMLSRSNDIYKKFYNFFIIEVNKYKEKPDLKQLCFSPYSLPILRTQDIQDKLDYILSNCIKGYSKNKDIKKLFQSIPSEDEITGLISYLFLSDPVKPKIINEIYARCTYGAHQSFLNTFTHMRTIRQLVFWESDQNYYSKLLHLELTNIIGIIELYIRSSKIEPTQFLECTYKIAYEIRSKLWFNNERKVEGVTIPFPFEQFLIYNHNIESPIYVKISSEDEKHEKLSEERCHIKIIYESSTRYVSYQHSSFPMLLTRGKFNPYVGSVYKDKSIKRRVRGYKRDSSFSDACRILEIALYNVIDDSNFQNYLLKLVETRTNTNIDLMKEYLGYTTNGIINSYMQNNENIYTNSISTRPNFSTHIYVDNSEMGKYDDIDNNYNISHQGMYMMAQSLLNEMYFLLDPILNNKMKIGGLYKQTLINTRIPLSITDFYIHLYCESCTNKVTKSLINNTSSDYPIINYDSSCNLLFADNILTLNNENLIRLTTDWFYINPKEMGKSQLSKMYHNLTADHLLKLTNNTDLKNSDFLPIISRSSISYNFSDLDIRLIIKSIVIYSFINNSKHLCKTLKNQRIIDIEMIMQSYCTFIPKYLYKTVQYICNVMNTTDNLYKLFRMKSNLMVSLDQSKEKQVSMNYYYHEKTYLKNTMEKEIEDIIMIYIRILLDEGISQLFIKIYETILFEVVSIPDKILAYRKYIDLIYTTVFYEHDNENVSVLDKIYRKHLKLLNTISVMDNKCDIISSMRHDLMQNGMSTKTVEKLICRITTFSIEDWTIIYKKSNFTKSKVYNIELPEMININDIKFIYNENSLYTLILSHSIIPLLVEKNMSNDNINYNLNMENTYQINDLVYRSIRRIKDTSSSNIELCLSMLISNFRSESFKDTIHVKSKVRYMIVDDDDLSLLKLFSRLEGEYSVGWIRKESTSNPLVMDNNLVDESVSIVSPKIDYTEDISVTDDIFDVLIDRFLNNDLKFLFEERLITDFISTNIIVILSSNNNSNCLIRLKNMILYICLLYLLKKDESKLNISITCNLSLNSPLHNIRFLLTLLSKMFTSVNLTIPIFVGDCSREILITASGLVKDRSLYIEIMRVHANFKNSLLDNSISLIGNMQIIDDILSVLSLKLMKTPEEISTIMLNKSYEKTILFNRFNSYGIDNIIFENGFISSYLTLYPSFFKLNNTSFRLISLVKLKSILLHQSLIRLSKIKYKRTREDDLDETIINLDNNIKLRRIDHLHLSSIFILSFVEKFLLNKNITEICDNIPTILNNVITLECFNVIIKKNCKFLYNVRTSSSLTEIVQMIISIYMFVNKGVIQ